MKTKITFLSIALSFSVISNAQQLLMEENFDYQEGAPLIANAVSGSDNAANTLTGWLTLAQSRSDINCFNISSVGLFYQGYPPTGKGKAVIAADNSGQDVFKPFVDKNEGVPYVGPKTIYVGLMVNIPFGSSTNPAVAKDFLIAIKATTGPTDYNYYGRIFIKSDGANTNFALGKYSSNSSAWSGNYANGATHLLVLKYVMGGLNGTNRNEEVAAGYDDKMHLFINPYVSISEPLVPTLSYESAAEGDAYRYSQSNVLIGGLSSVYMRTPDNAAGSIPTTTIIDGIRVAESWAALFTTTTGVDDVVKQNGFVYRTDNENRLIDINISNRGYHSYQLISMSGSLVNAGSVENNNFAISTKGLAQGVYLLTLQGDDGPDTAKIIIR
ncbi:MAG: T9SS type A sorting domain-containing protein [Paludibacter sp.]|nr:T9SS type A sorting domain-containing protein [Paludibacter sp.]